MHQRLMGLALLFFLLAACAPDTSTAMNPADGVVTGRIQECYQGLQTRPSPTPNYIGGIVDIHSGTSSSSADYLSGPKVASQTVSPGDRFRFELSPGTYWIVLHGLSGKPVPSLFVTVQKGKTTNADIFGGCF